MLRPLSLRWRAAVIEPEGSPLRVHVLVSALALKGFPYGSFKRTLIWETPIEVRCFGAEVYAMSAYGPAEYPSPKKVNPFNYGGII